MTHVIPRRPDEAFDFDADYGANYEKLAHQLIPGYAQLFSMTLALLENRVAANADVLVVGAGTGIEMAAFGEARPAWRIAGVDPSRQMIDLAQRKLRERGLDGQYHIHHGYVDELPAEPAYDLATLFNVMHFMPDDGAKLGLLKSIAIRLRPGALFVIVDLHGDPSSEEFAVLMKAWSEFMLLRGLTQEERRVFLNRLDEGMHYVSERRVLELLAEAGFESVKEFYRAFLYRGWICEGGAGEDGGAGGTP